jgi:hypothetical protein
MSVGAVTVRLNRPDPRRRKQNLNPCPSFCPCYPTRYEKTARNFLAAVQLVASVVWLKLMTDPSLVFTVPGPH